MRSPRHSKSRRRQSLVLPLVVAMIATAAALAGCGAGEGPGGSTDPGGSTGPDARAGGAGSQRSAPGAGTVEARLAALERSSPRQRRTSYVDRVRESVVRGAGRDFAAGTRIGGPSFEACVKRRLGEALDGPTISNLVAIFHRRHGMAYVAQALNALAEPLAARCGHRYWVPELVEAANGLRSAAPSGAAIEKLGVTYGPYFGRRCHRPGPRNCDTIGIDVAFGHAATRVVAVVGSQAIRLRTPGLHNAIPHRDWVGTFTHANFARLGGHPHRTGNVAYTAVELRVRFADGRRARALFPRVLVSPGWC
jgi:hypothetical protein